MTLDEIRKIIAESTADDWSALATDIGTYVTRFTEVGGPDGHWLEIAEHHSRVVLKEDADVGLVWGMRPESDDDEPSEAEWAKSLMSSSVRPGIAEVLYRGEPVDRVVYVLIDNSHSRVPWPSPRFVASPSGE